MDDLTEHNRGGVHLTEYAAEHAGDPRIRELAGRMVTAQQAEIREYDARAAELGFRL